MRSFLFRAGYFEKSCIKPASTHDVNLIEVLSFVENLLGFDNDSRTSVPRAAQKCTKRIFSEMMSTEKVVQCLSSGG